MKSLVTLLLSACSIACVLELNGQRMQPASVAEDWRWNELESLHEYRIQSGAEDENGQLWFVHKDGLIKYDGVGIESFPARDYWFEGATDIFISSTGLIAIPTNHGLHIFDDNRYSAHSELYYSLGSRNAIAEDKQGRLFTVNEVTGECMLINGGKLESLGVKLGQPTSLLIDSKSNLWVVDSGKHEVSVFQFQGEGASLELKLLHSIPTNPMNRYFTRLLEDSAGRVWVIDPDEQDHCHFYVDYQRHPGFSGLREANLWGEMLNVAETPNGNLLFCLNRRLGRLDGNKLAILDIQDHPIPSSPPYLRVLASGKVLIGGRNLNPYLIDLSTDHWQAYQGLNFQCEDAKGNKWFLSHDRKALMEEAGVWSEFDVASGLIDTPNRIMAGDDGSVWVSGSHLGRAAVSWLYKGKWSLQVFPQAATTFSHLAALQIDHGRFAFGCGTPRGELGDLAGGGVIFEKQEDTYRGMHFPPPVFISRPATMAYSDRDGLYLGEGNIARAFSNRELIATDLNVFQSQWIDHMIVDRRNNLWVACLGVGVYQFDGETWTLHGTNTGLSNPDVICLLDDVSKGGILALSEEGFHYYDGARWRDWAFRSDLPFRRENHTLFQGNDGAIWINYSNRRWFLEGEPIKDQPENFKTIRYVPDSQPPETFAFLSKGEFPEGSQVSVVFDGIDPWDATSKKDLTFSWKLNNGDWSVFTSGSQTVLDNLKSGSYVVQVRARDMEGNVDGSPAILAFAITPPLWQRPLFVLGGLVLFALIVALAYSLFHVRIQAAVAMETFKLDFFTNISHELRNPLAVILAPVERLLKDESDAEKRQKLSIVLRNARKMQGMVDQLLQFRKLQAGKRQVHSAAGEIISFVEDCVSNLKPLWENKGQELQMTANPESCICAFDPDIIQSVIDNLVSNAVKYSEPETRISVRVTVSHIDKLQQLSLEVEDEGASIPSHERENILTPFYRINNNGGEMGTGIGLAVVDQLVKLCGGTMEIDSPLTRDGKGSRFTVTIPLDAVDKKHWQKEDHSADHEPSASEMTVLVVEDNADFRYVIAQELSAYYTVIEAVDGEDGLNQAIKTDPDIIVSDVIMPKLDGYELCERLKSHSETSHIPIILLTAKSADEHRIKGLQAGADAYIPKPLKIDHLLARIENLLTSRQELRELFSRRIVVHPSEITVTSTDERILEKAIKIVDENMIEEDFDAEQFSRLMGMSKSSLARKLKAITGVTPLHFVQSMRLKRAAVLLKEGTSVSEAAAQVGIYNMSYFSKLFRKEFGVVPSEYKKS